MGAELYRNPPSDARTLSFTHPQCQVTESRGDLTIESSLRSIVSSPTVIAGAFLTVNAGTPFSIPDSGPLFAVLLDFCSGTWSSAPLHKLLLHTVVRFVPLLVDNVLFLDDKPPFGMLVDASL